jgi:hypothetical protein
MAFDNSLMQSRKKRGHDWQQVVLCQKPQQDSLDWPKGPIGFCHKLPLKVTLVPFYAVPCARGCGDKFF